MSSPRENSSELAPVAARFTTTHWSVVLAAKGAQSRCPLPVFALETGQELFTFDKYRMVGHSAWFSPNSEYLAVSGDDGRGQAQLALWRAPSWTEIGPKVKVGPFTRSHEGIALLATPRLFTNGDNLSPFAGPKAAVGNGCYVKAAGIPDSGRFD